LHMGAHHLDDVEAAQQLLQEFGWDHCGSLGRRKRNTRQGRGRCRVLWG
jgi:hypothetical protein